MSSTVYTAEQEALTVANHPIPSTHDGYAYLLKGLYLLGSAKVLSPTDERALSHIVDRVRNKLLRDEGFALIEEGKRRVASAI